jgi:hypothetical protein
MKKNIISITTYHLNLWILPQAIHQIVHILHRHSFIDGPDIGSCHLRDAYGHSVYLPLSKDSNWLVGI